MRKTYGLVGAATVLAVTLFWFRPGGVEGPRPAPSAPTGKGFSHASFGAVLQTAVKADGSVDYAALRATPGPLDAYLGQLRAASPATAPHRFKTDDDRLAYYLNAYNAFMLATVRDHCPIEDVQTAYVGGGLFWRVSFLLGEEPTTLSALESERIRSVMNKRGAVHFAVVKGARGFPALSGQAYEGATLGAQLEALSARVLADERFARREGEVLVLSRLFEWYLADFDADPVAWIKARAPALAEGVKRIEYTDFDWQLNGGC
jgi:hypothetical protein